MMLLIAPLVAVGFSEPEIKRRPMSLEEDERKEKRRDRRGRETGKEGEGGGGRGRLKVREELTIQRVFLEDLMCFYYYFVFNSHCFCVLKSKSTICHTVVCSCTREHDSCTGGQINLISAHLNAEEKITKSPRVCRFLFLSPK